MVDWARRGQTCGGAFAGRAWGVALAAVLTMTVVPAAAFGAVGVEAPLTLAEARRVAEQGNPAYRRACLAVDQAGLALARLQADAAIRANALALQQAESAKATAEVAREAAGRKLWLDVQRAYYTLLTARRQQQLAREALDQAQEQLRVAQRRLGSGAGTRLEVLNAERVAAEAEAGVAKADTGARLAELTLRDLLGWPSGKPLVLDEHAPSDFRPVPEEEAAVRLALERSPEVRQAREAVAAARLAVSLGENDYTPDLAQKLAAARLAEAQLGAEEAERRMALQVRRALAELGLAETGVKAAVKATAAAVEGHRAARVRFDTGATGLDEVLAAQVRLFQARQTELQARLDLDLARTAVFSLIGE
ncbi:MAG TPA: TolC family protein [Firmicutes bacterium]|nr:TolC family protein [Bacillota bacterium]